MDEGGASGPSDWPALRRERRALVVVDVVESVRLMIEDEEDAVRRWQRFVDHVTRDVLPQHRGSLVKSLGDGLLLDFHTSRDALACSMAMQSHIISANAEVPATRRMKLRVGVHAAEVVVDKLDVYGAGVNLTARLASLAEPDQIVVSAECRDALTDGLDAVFEDMGECFLKHIARPVRAFRVWTQRSDVADVRPFVQSADLRPTIAVIPFSATDDDPETRAAGDLLADEIIFSLSAADALNVISRMSTAAFKDRPIALPELAGVLGATYVLSGTIDGRADRLAMRLELAEVATGSIVWQDRLRCGARDLCQPASGIVGGIVAAVAAAIVARELTLARSQPLSTLRSSSLMFAAVNLMHRATSADIGQAKAVLEHLAERENKHPKPDAWLSNWYAMSVTQLQAAQRDEHIARALYHARRALGRDPRCALALAIDGVVHVNLLRDFDAGETKLQAAVEINPNEALAWLFKGVLHAFRGEGEPARQASERALALSPLDPMRHYYESLAATAALGAADYARATQLALSSIRGNRTHPSTFRALAIAQAMAGDSGGAALTVERLLSLTPGYRVEDFARQSGFGAGPLGRDFSEALRSAGMPA